MVNDYLFQYDIDGGVCGMVPSAHAQLSSRRKVARTSLNYFLFSFLYKNYIRCKFLQIVFDEQYDCSPSGVYRCPPINIIGDYGSTGMYAIINYYVTAGYVT